MNERDLRDGFTGAELNEARRLIAQGATGEEALRAVAPEVVGQSTAPAYVILRLDLAGSAFVDPERLGNVVRRQLLGMGVDVDGVELRVSNVVLSDAGSAG